MNIDIDATTLSALDWNAVLEALSERARTPMGRAAALRPEVASRASTAQRWLDQVDEVLLLESQGGWVPVGGVQDVREALRRAGKGGVLDGDELRSVGRTLESLDQLGSYLLGTDHDVPVLSALAPGLAIERTVIDTLRDAFDDQGQLSARMWPVLGELRGRIASLHTTIRRRLDELVKGDELTDVLQDRFVTQRGDRYVIPVKANFRRKEFGIVHGMSGSGQTAFVEPHEIVVLNNDLRIAEGELEAAERRILAQLSGMVGRVAPRALSATDVATEIDLACARADMARRLEATRPVVQAEGVVRLKQARHPLLVLRGLEVVANDLILDGRTPALVVSGPNTGGKTIALKTLGLAAMLVRIGCFVPAAEGSRVDIFHDIVAVIGDHQTVHGDHSSFSSHLVALREMVKRARSGCLYLVDEIASGTDPEQGAALAHAVLERFVAADVRALITTHFHRLKTLGARDARVAMAGMQFADGKPTYRLIVGASGESHALEIARRMGLEDVLVDRARALMDEGERQLADALVSLDRERARAEEAAREAKTLAVALEAQRVALEKREARLTAEAQKIERERAAGFLERVAAAEEAIGQVVAELQRAPSHDKVAAARAAVQGLAGLAPKAPKAPDRAGPRGLEVGDRVRLRGVGETGEVIGLGRKIQVRTKRGLTLQVKPGDLERLNASGAVLPVAPPVQPAPRSAKASTTPLEAAMRYEGNTLDLRGKRVDEGLEEVELFLDKASMEDQQVVFVLHGHGTGAMKQAVRRWLKQSPYVQASRPANADQGGDAYTVVAVK